METPNALFQTGSLAGQTPFGVAAMTGDLNLVKVLAPFVDLGGLQIEPLPGKGMTAIGLATMEEKLDVIKFLAQLIGPNASANDSGMPAIFFGIAARKSEAVKLLASLSRNLPTSMWNGFTPLELAEAEGDDKI